MTDKKGGNSDEEEDHPHMPVSMCTSGCPVRYAAELNERASCLDGYMPRVEISERNQRLRRISWSLAIGSVVSAYVALAVLDGTVERWVATVLISVGLASLVIAYVLMHVDSFRRFRYLQAHPESRPNRMSSLIRAGVVVVIFIVLAAVGAFQGNSQVVGLSVVGVLCFGGLGLAVLRRDSSQ